jgi:ATP-dependent RNA helicase DDX41
MILFVLIMCTQGLDFPDIQHVINFDMPAEIENYVHRIGRTGRCGKTGVATTFINKVSLCYTLCLLQDAAACRRL